MNQRLESFTKLAKKMLAGALAMMLVVVGVVALSKPMQTAALTPRVMLTDYSIAEGKVTSGKDFTLKLVLTNTAAKTGVRNLKVSVSSEAGEFIPVEGAGTAYIDKIDATKDAELAFKLHALDGLEEKSYKMTIHTEYEDGNSIPYDVTDTIYINISLDQRVSITDVYLANDMVQLSDTVEVVATVNNLGAGTLYNVTAHIKGDNIKEQTSYIGNIESGKSGNVDALTKADAISHNAGDVNKLIISYEDKAGNVYESESEIYINVSQPMYENLEKVKDSGNASQVIKQVAIVLVVVAVIALLIFLAYKRFKKKQKMLEDL